MAEKLSAHCHCGAVAFTVELSDGFNTVRRCNCSYCRMRGAVAVSSPRSGIEVVRGGISSQSIALIQGKPCTFLLGMRDLHLSSTAIKPRAVWGECGLH